MNRLQEASVYWIRLSHHTDYLTQGYVGVSKRVSSRIAGHYKNLLTESHKNPHLTYAFKKYGLESFMVEIILSGEESYCYAVEAEWRPHSNIGWNIAPGGHRGPGWPKGKKASITAIQKSVATRREKYNARIIEKLKLEENSTNQKVIIENFIEQQIANVKLAKLRAKEEKARLKQEEKAKVKLAKLRAKEEKARLKQEEKLEKIRVKKEEAIAKQQDIERVKLEKIKEKEEASLRKLCPICQQKPVSINCIRNGKRYYRKTCEQCAAKNAKLKPKPHLWVKAGYKKKPHCEKCGFVAVFNDQLQVFHLDGNLKNVEWTNLKTICANCAIEVYKSKMPWRLSIQEH